MSSSSSRLQPLAILKSPVAGWARRQTPYRQEVDMETIVIPSVVVVAVLWVIRAIALWVMAEFDKRS